MLCLVTFLIVLICVEPANATLLYADLGGESHPTDLHGGNDYIDANGIILNKLEPGGLTPIGPGEYIISGICYDFPIDGLDEFHFEVGRSFDFTIDSNHNSVWLQNKDIQLNVFNFPGPDITVTDLPAGNYWFRVACEGGEGTFGPWTVSLDVVPEPGGLLLLCTGMVIMICFRPQKW